MSLRIIGAPISANLDYFNVIKAPPEDVLEVDVVDDSAYKINNLYKKIFQFKYRFVYDDNEKSVWSAISRIPLPAKSTDSAYNALNNVQNAINIKVPTGGFNVSKVEIAGRVNIESVWSDFFLVDTLDKERDGISDNSIYEYIFRNDSVYTQIDIQESNLLFDHVPDEANALELANGNTLVVGGLKDGYDRDVKLDVVLTNISNLNSPAVLSTLVGEARNVGDTAPFSYIDNGIWNRVDEIPLGLVKFSGTPQVGDVITITIFGFNSERWFGPFEEFTDRDFGGSRANGESFSVTVVPGMDIPGIVDAFINHPNNGTGSAWNVVGLTARPTRPIINPTNFTPLPNCVYFGAEAINPPVFNNEDLRRYIYEGISVSIRRGFSFGESDVFPVYKWSGVYKFGLVYYDKNGKTNGVFTNPSMTLRTGPYNTDYDWTPDVPATPVILPENETAQLYIGHTPPDWADYYHVVRTKELSCDFSLMVVSPNTIYSGNYMFLDIGNITATATVIRETAEIINYGTTSFVNGDRVRILHGYNIAEGKTIWTSQNALDLPILAVETDNNRLRLRVKNVDVGNIPNTFKPGNGTATLIEIYRPAKVLSDEDLVYYEIGYKYDILTGLDGRKYHSGETIVNNIPISQYLITAPSSVVFYSANRMISISRPSGISAFSVGDVITISGSASNNGTYTVTSSAITTGGAILEIYVSQALVDETIGSPNIILRKIATPNRPYTYINMFNDGDYYYKTRSMVSSTNNTTVGSFIAADKNFSETFSSAVWSQGRPLIVDENIKEEYFPAMLRFSQSYIYGTNINNLSRFYPNNFEEADASFGPILRLKTRENFIRMFQKFKVGMLPIYRQIIVDNAQSSQVALSERLLNKPNYYSGEYGIDKYGSSLISTDYGDYFVDSVNRAIVRVSLDGITNVSDTNNLMGWCNDNINENSYGYGCFNYENRNVVMLIGSISSDSGVLTNNIVAYNEPRKKFDSFYGFIKAQSIIFSNGYLWTLFVDPTRQVDRGWHVYKHDSDTRNNFFGEQQSSSITTFFNGNLQFKKTYIAIEELANGLWTGAVTTGPLTNQYTTLVEADFQKAVGAFVINSKENKFNATIKRDMTTVGGKFQGDTMKGLFAQVALTNSLTTEQRLISVSLKYIPSPLTNS
jgi:hypothetical protein